MVLECGLGKVPMNCKCLVCCRLESVWLLMVVEM